MNRLRRRLLAGFALGAVLRRARAAFDYPQVEPRSIAFPRDYGAHLAYRIEWWYMTGLLDPPDKSSEPRLGIQLTFFRIRPPVDPDNPSRFAAHQLVLAHAAVADPRRGALLHQERIERAGFGIASVSELGTEVHIDRWGLHRDPTSGVYRGQARGARFALQVTARPTQPPLLQGQHGYSRKGPAGAPEVPASFYYSEPQLVLEALVSTDSDSEGALRTGRGWLDHEWSSRVLPPQAAGWDWMGCNLNDGSALTAFQIRPAGDAVETEPWFAYASLRARGALIRTFEASQVRFEVLQRWTSPRTRAVYPVAQRLRVGERVFETRPLMLDQELDPRAAGGVAYWEGASDLLEDGRVIGEGYLELTGYAAPMSDLFTG